MNKYEIVKKIEQIAPCDTAEPWDCVGFIVETSKTDVSKVMLCLTPTDDVIRQACEQGCDMIISHHPLFYVPLKWNYIDIYSAHTNLDKADGGTTDTLIKSLGLRNFRVNIEHDFIRMIDFGKDLNIEEVSQMMTKISPSTRLVNNNGVKTLRRIAFCAGSGSEFIRDAKILGAEALVTGDLKFHTALDSDIIVYDVGHYESEIFVLPEIKNVIEGDIEAVFAKERSPFQPIT